MEHPFRKIDSDLYLDLGCGVDVVCAEAVVDFTASGDVLGFEAFGLLSERPALSLSSHGVSNIALSADADADAIYVRFSHGYSSDQRECLAIFAVDKADRILAVRLQFDS